MLLTFVVFSVTILGVDIGADFFVIVVEALILSVFPLITLCITCYALERKIGGYSSRICHFASIAEIVFTFAFVLIPFVDMSMGLYEALEKILMFLVSAVEIPTIVYALITLIKPNNMFTRYTKFVCYGALAAKCLTGVIVSIKTYFVDTLPNIYGNVSLGLPSISSTSAITDKINLIAIFALIFGLAILYISNYAFEGNVVDVDSMEYDELLKNADLNNLQRLDSIYTNNTNNVNNGSSYYMQGANNNPNNVSNDTNAMNVNNQLLKDSNVGEIQNKENLSNYVESNYIPKSSGPVINNNVNDQTVLNNTENFNNK